MSPVFLPYLLLKKVVRVVVMPADNPPVGVMRDCIVITPQHTRELFGCVEGMSVTYINQKKVKAWLKTFPGALNDTGDIPVIKRGRVEGRI